MAAHLSAMTREELFEYIQHLEHNLSYERFLREKLEKRLAPAPAPAAEPGMGHKEAAIVAPVAPVAPAVEEDRKTMPEDELRRRYFPIPNDVDNAAYPWTYRGVTYVATYDRMVFHIRHDGSIGNWVGIYDIRNDVLDTSAPEPEFEDEDGEETDNDE